MNGCPRSEWDDHKPFPCHFGDHQPVRRATTGRLEEPWLAEPPGFIQRLVREWCMFRQVRSVAIVDLERIFQVKQIDVEASPGHPRIRM